MKEIDRINNRYLKRIKKENKEFLSDLEGNVSAITQEMGLIAKKKDTEDRQ